MMKFTKIIPYLLTVAVVLSADLAISYSNADKTQNKKVFESKYNLSGRFETEYNLKRQIVEAKAQRLIDTYINYAVEGTKRIIENKKKKNYSSAVREELPGAPSDKIHGTLHCLYGQYTQLSRALTEMGDTIQIIPCEDNAHMATSSFKRHMTKLYDCPEYPNSIYRGHLYESNTEYNKALDKYITDKINNNKVNNQDSLRNLYVKEFEKSNYCIDNLNPGTIIIVNSGHAVMFLGKGIVQNKEFIPDENGQAICCAYNAEQPAIYLSAWNTTNSFAADIKNIATQKYHEQMIKQKIKTH